MNAYFEDETLPSGRSASPVWLSSDETPVWEDDLSTERVAVECGAEMVRVRVNHASCRAKHTALLSSCSKPNVCAPPREEVLFRATNGKTILNRMQKQRS